jgi:D-3-phosphoglycerate dehydrogenase
MAAASTSRRVAILGTRYSDLSVEEEILAPLDVVIASGPGADEAAIIEIAADAEVILAGSGPRFTAAVLENLSCRALVRYGVGVDSIDLVAADRLGIAVASVPDYGTEAVATHTLALALAALRQIPRADREVQAGKWTFADLRPLHLPSALTAGVVGYGRIGSAVGHRLQAVGFEVLAHDPLVEAAAVPLVPLNELLAGSDLVTLHAPGRPDGAPLIDRAALALMRPGSILVNTARGSLVDMDALVEGMQDDRPRYACLDVFPVEPPPPAGWQAVSDRLIRTPHMAWYTEESQLELREKAAREAGRALRGEPLLNPVGVATPP